MIGLEHHSVGNGIVACVLCFLCRLRCVLCVGCVVCCVLCVGCVGESGLCPIVPWRTVTLLIQWMHPSMIFGASTSADEEAPRSL